MVNTGSITRSMKLLFFCVKMRAADRFRAMNRVMEELSCHM